MGKLAKVPSKLLDGKKKKKKSTDFKERKRKVGEVRNSKIAWNETVPDFSTKTLKVADGLQEMVLNPLNQEQLEGSLETVRAQMSKQQPKKRLVGLLNLRKILVNVSSLMPEQFPPFLALALECLEDGDDNTCTAVLGLWADALSGLSENRQFFEALQFKSNLFRRVIEALLCWSGSKPPKMACLWLDQVINQNALGAFPFIRKSEFTQKLVEARMSESDETLRLSVIHGLWGQMKQQNDRVSLEAPRNPETCWFNSTQLWGILEKRLLDGCPEFCKLLTEAPTVGCPLPGPTHGIWRALVDCLSDNPDNFQAYLIRAIFKGPKLYFQGARRNLLKLLARVPKDMGALEALEVYSVSTEDEEILREVLGMDLHPKQIEYLVGWYCRRKMSAEATDSLVTRCLTHTSQPGWAHIWFPFLETLQTRDPPKFEVLGIAVFEELVKSPQNLCLHPSLEEICHLVFDNSRMSPEHLLGVLENRELPPSLREQALLFYLTNPEYPVDEAGLRKAGEDLLSSDTFEGFGARLQISLRNRLDAS